MHFPVSIQTSDELASVQAWCQQGGDEFRRGPARAGGWVTPTQGEVWPKPRQQTTSLQFFTLNSTAFRFQVRQDGEMVRHDGDCQADIDFFLASDRGSSENFGLKTRISKFFI